MARKGLVFAVCLGLLVAVTGVALASSPAPAARAQASEEQPEEVLPDAPLLSPGERYEAGLWDLEVQGSVLVPSMLRTGYSEVGVSVAYRNVGNPGMLFSTMGLIGEYGYPSVQMRDAAGVVHPLPRVLPRFFSSPGSNLVAQDPGVPARWSLGFEIPAALDDELVFEVVADGQVVARWDLYAPPIALQGWDAPAGVEQVTWGDAIEWGEALSVTPLSAAVDICGDPDVGEVAALTSMLVTVENQSDLPAFWPKVLFPEVPVIAIWEDGSSAEYLDETLVLDPGETEEEATDKVLRHRTEEQVIMPPRLTFERAVDFIVARDSRFSSVLEQPQAYLFLPPGGSPVWLDATEPPAADPLDVAGVACTVAEPDPFPFTAGNEPISPVTDTDGTADLEAQDSLRAARAAAVVLYVDSGNTFATLVPEDFSDAGLDRAVTADVTAANASTIGYLSEDQRLLLVTQSSEGSWFCLVQDYSRTEPVTFATGNGLADVNSFGECTDPSW